MEDTLIRWITGFCNVIVNYGEIISMLESQGNTFGQRQSLDSPPNTYINFSWHDLIKL